MSGQGELKRVRVHGGRQPNPNPLQFALSLVSDFSIAWLYSGMAFRMAIDLGVHLPTEKFQSYVKILSAEDIEVRRRIFWSCYAWDKCISVYMGRMPMFTPAADVPLTFGKLEALGLLHLGLIIDRGRFW